jgi:hypothetical protein
MWLRTCVGAALVTALAFTSQAQACSLCTNPFSTLTFRQEASQKSCRIIVFGTVTDSKILPGGNGFSKVRIDAVLKSDPFIKGKTEIEVPKAVPVDGKNPPKFLVFCDVYKGKLDPYHGVPVQSKEAADYVKGALAVDGKDRTTQLLYYFDFLEHSEKKIAEDAFLEFAKSTDKEIAQAGAKLKPEKLRRWLGDRETLDYRLGLYAFLLGASGGADDAACLRSLLTQKQNDRTLKAFDGALSGYIQLRPKEGWQLALDILGDDRQMFMVRYAALRSLKFQYSAKPEDNKTNMLKGLGSLVPQGDIADLAIRTLYEMKLWDLTSDVLAQYGKKSHSAPLMRRCIIRYALLCPKPEAARFIAERRKNEPDLVKDEEEVLQIEKTPSR